MNKREWVARVLGNETAGPVPVGFWFHFVPDELRDGFVHPEIFGENIRGHEKFYRDFQPDLVKIMTDGFFIYPNREFRAARTAADLWKVQSIGADHPWMDKQVEFAKTLTGMFGKEVFCFYNIFSPATTFKFVRLGSGEFRASGLSADAVLADFMLEDPGAVRHALNTAAGDLAILARRVIEEGGADGIYLSAQDPGDPRIGVGLHREILAPAGMAVLEAANAARSVTGKVFNILHICGYEGHRNDLNHFVNYPAQIINWAAVFEGVSLARGKRLFGNRPVIGGFDNTVKGLLYRGTEAEIKAETRRLIGETGKTGLILGADCTLPRDIDLRRLQWVREAAAN
ncbi:MAG: uroporphyrinogen decarboxylase [Treponema sp.]|jgi:uroporphyrinogen decarboxylase|nr:uroporphyrinogen decarboxylase [Treponema sp.]